MGKNYVKIFFLNCLIENCKQNCFKKICNNNNNNNNNLKGELDEFYAKLMCLESHIWWEMTWISVYKRG